MKTLFLLLSLISLNFAQEFFQKDIRSIVQYPFDDAPDKFLVRYISPTKSPPQDSIFEEKRHFFNEKKNNWLDRYSIFLWKTVPTRDIVFFTSATPLIRNLGYHYNYYDPNPEEKGVFYITEDLFRKGDQIIVYCQGVKRLPLDTIFVNPDTVLVSIFSPYNWIDPLTFNFVEQVSQNTTFKVFSGKTASNTYLHVDMYHGDTFVKTVYKWDSVAGAGAGQTTALIRTQKFPTFTIHKDFDLNGRSISNQTRKVPHEY